MMIMMMIMMMKVHSHTVLHWAVLFIYYCSDSDYCFRWYEEVKFIVIDLITDIDLVFTDMHISLEFISVYVVFALR